MPKTGVQTEIDLNDARKPAQSPAEFIPAAEITEVMNRKSNPDQTEVDFGAIDLRADQEKPAIDLADEGKKEFHLSPSRPIKIIKTAETNGTGFIHLENGFGKQVEVKLLIIAGKGDLPEAFIVSGAQGLSESEEQLVKIEALEKFKNAPVAAEECNPKFDPNKRIDPHGSDYP